MPHKYSQVVWFGLLTLAACAAEARGATILVPDQAPTIQDAIDAGPDTILIRPAAYAESPVVWRPVVMIGASPSPDDSPSLEGLRIDPSVVAYSDGYALERITVLSAVVIRNELAHAVISFTSCKLRGGISDISFSDRTWRVSLDRCDVEGQVELYALDSCHVEACRIVGGIQCSGLSTSRLTVMNSTLTGNGSGYGIEALRIFSVRIFGNEVRGHGIGMSIRAEIRGSVTDNLVEGCYGAGIAMGQCDALEVSRNIVRECGQGIDLNAGEVVALENRLERCRIRDLWRGHGMRVGAHVATVERNVASQCEGDGLTVEFLGGVGSRIANNTSCLNGGSGVALRLNLLDGDGGTEVVGNIGWTNGAWGINWLRPVEGRVSTVACNDWLGNGAGEVGGATPSPEDIAVDPQFCDPVTGDFHLKATSALVEWPGCGLLGAMGMGCGVTATVVARFSARRRADGVEIVWELGRTAAADGVWIERAVDADAGPWLRPTTERRWDGQTAIEMDRTALVGERYWYRLMVREGDVTAVAGAPIAVEASEGSNFRLGKIGPNPASGPIRIEFHVARPSIIEIDVFDVQGRAVASVARGEWPAGTHIVEWEESQRRGSMTRAGWYIVRYRFPGGQEARRIVRAR